MKNTGVTVTKVATSFIGAVGFYSDDNRYSTQFMSNYVDIYVKNALKRIHGVADVQIFGERKYSMRLWLDPSRLAARGLTASDVVSALQQQNVQIAAGQVGQEPASKDQMFQISVRAAGRLTEASQFDDIILKPGAQWRAGSAERRRTRGTRSRKLRWKSPLQWLRRRRHRHFAASDRQCARC